MKCFTLLCLPLIALLASCSTTPQSRIQNNPELFLSLNSKQQAEVREGKISQGMPESGVYLAMGSPDSKVTGNRAGRTYVRWDYTELIPVYTTGFGGYGGFGGYYGHGRYYGAGYYPTVTYIPARGSSVYFKKGRVAGWERKQR